MTWRERRSPEMQFECAEETLAGREHWIGLLCMVELAGASSAEGNRHRKSVFLTKGSVSHGEVLSNPDDSEFAKVFFAHIEMLFGECHSWDRHGYKLDVGIRTLCILRRAVATT